jgi:hypothetical protein
MESGETGIDDYGSALKGLSKQTPVATKSFTLRVTGDVGFNCSDQSLNRMEKSCIDSS